jgi:hypothetical protein
MRRLRFVLPILLLSLTTSRTARAGGGAASDAYEDVRADAPVDVHGLSDIYFQGNFNRPTSSTSQLRSFDTRVATPALGVLRLTAAHAPSPFGFRLDVAVGDLPDAYLRFDPAATAHPELSRALSYFEQAFVTATLPFGRGLRLDVGKFETPIGLEDNEARTNWNYARSFLYLLAEPSFHSGLRLTYPLTENLAVSGYWVNGWDANVLEGNGMRAAAAAVTWTPSERVEAVVDYMGGLERAPTRLADPTLTFRHAVDAYVTYALTDRVSFACTADYGHDAAQSGVDWWGIGGYVRYRALDWLALAVRGEHYADPDGFTSGAPQRLAEITTTLEAREQTGPLTIALRLEYRRDQSDTPVFETSSARPAPHQDTLGLSAVTAF